MDGSGGAPEGDLLRSGRPGALKTAESEFLFRCYSDPNNNDIFTTPTAEEAAFVARIYEVQHFQQNIELKKLLKGGYNADPFVIARAAVSRSTVVTMEQFKDNAAKIPNICTHFAVPCMTLEQFMEAEGWTF